MIIIGLCGGSGSGKSAVSGLFRDRGIPAIDADAVYHDITSKMSPCLIELRDVFGSDIVKDGALDREQLRRIVFSGDNVADNLTLLNSVSHKHVVKEMRRIASEYEKDGCEILIYDAPLLFEAGIDADCSQIICVVADKNIRIRRIMERDGISCEEATRRIESQKDDRWLISRCDFVIENNGDIDSLCLSVENCLSNILNNK